MKLIFFIATVVTISGCAQTGLKESLGSTWRTGTPENAVLGAYGIRTVTKDGIIFTENGRLPDSILEVRPSEARTVKYHSAKEAESELSKDEIGKLGLSYSDIINNGYNVISTRLDNTKKIANQLLVIDGLDEKYLSLQSLRFITGVAQIFNHSQTKDVKVGGTIDVEAAKKFDGKIVLKGKIGSNTELNYSDGATVAYTYARICWNEDGSINYLQEEAPNPWYLFWSNSFDCAEGTYEKNPKLSTN